MQNRLSLVLGRVSGCDNARSMPLGDCEQEFISRVARCAFDPVTLIYRGRRNVASPNFTWNRELLAKLDNEALVAVGRWPQTVIEVPNDKLPRPGRFDALGRAQQRGTVCAARNGQYDR
jgi:hypothetical protein